MSPDLEQALAARLLALADDELILAHRNSEWTGHAPILEEDIAFTNIALDEMGHARIWYEQLEALQGADPDSLIFFRPAAEFSNVRMVELPPGDWAFSMLRQYLFDSYELVRATQTLESRYRPMAEAAAKIRPEELYHHRHTALWVRRLGLGTEESNGRMQQALDSLWPAVFQLFAPLPGEEQLVAAGYVPAPAQLQAAWEREARPFLEDAGLRLPPDPQAPATVAPRSEHTEHLEPLVADLQEVARLEREAEW
ncbi:MAG: 1,2-phenylacetyl-CoA epoxidase subunit PaaC [Candidatus Promineifilaceae bacterium]|nr:1,2-phenylacetyl-CoA epoxidase subunit PaaC [Candidatus Promineifilaceae bacterium]